MMWGYYGSWGGMLVMMASVLFWVALLGVLLFFVVRRLGPQWSSRLDSPRSLSAMEVLEQRYARGEIDDATFKRMRDELQMDQLHVTPIS